MEGYTYRVTAKLANGINYALSNYIDCSKGNGVYDLIDIIEDADGNPEEAVRMLNKCNRICDKFSTHRKLIDGFILCATDCWGNKSFITIRRM